MKLSISNFSKIQKADITLDSITVITGLNNTGKTTIGKLLYAYTKTFNSIENQTENLRNDRISSIIDNYYDVSFGEDVFRPFFGKEERLKDKFISIEGIDKSDKVVVKKELANLVSEIPEEYQHRYHALITNIDTISEKISEVYTISSNELERVILQQNLKSEFEGQLNNLYKKSQEDCIIKISSNDKEILTTEIKENEVSSLKREASITSTSLFVASPFIIDNNYRLYRLSHHKDDLHSAIYRKENVIDKILCGRKLNKILEKMSAIVKGTIDSDYTGDEGYTELDMKEPLRISNLSAGLKTFFVLKKLIENGSLNDNSILILDEPEIHLHPEWQFAYAELIVLLNLEVGLKVLLTTHSPYFLNAIEVYSKKHNVNNVNYYLSQVEDNFVEFERANNNLDHVYDLLTYPFKKLKDID